MTARLPLAWRLRAAASIAVIPPLLNVVSFARITGWLSGPHPPRRTDDRVDDEHLSKWVNRALRRAPGPWRHTCLRRATVLYYLLRRAGRQVELHIGVRRDDAGGVVAHAWLVQDGVPYLEANHARLASYRLIASLPDGSSAGRR